MPKAAQLQFCCLLSLYREITQHYCPCNRRRQVSLSEFSSFGWLPGRLKLYATSQVSVTSLPPSKCFFLSNKKEKIGMSVFVSISGSFLLNYSLLWPTLLLLLPGCTRALVSTKLRHRRRINRKPHPLSPAGAPMQLRTAPALLPRPAQTLCRRPRRKAHEQTRTTTGRSKPPPNLTWRRRKYHNLRRERCRLRRSNLLLARTPRSPGIHPRRSRSKVLRNRQLRRRKKERRSQLKLLKARIKRNRRRTARPLRHPPSQSSRPKRRELPRATLHLERLDQRKRIPRLRRPDLPRQTQRLEAQKLPRGTRHLEPLELHRLIKEAAAQDRPKTKERRSDSAISQEPVYFL